MHILKKDQTNAGETPYKTLKQELLKLYAPKKAAAFQLALSRRLTGKPSTLAKQLIDDLCTCDVPLQSECCQRVIWGLWSDKLPLACQQKLAGLDFNKDSYKQMLDLADSTLDTLPSASSTSAPVASVASASSLDDTQPAIPYAVSAVRGGRGGRGSGRGGRGGRRCR